MWAVWLSGKASLHEIDCHWCIDDLDLALEALEFEGKASASDTKELEQVERELRKHA